MEPSLSVLPRTWQRTHLQWIRSVTGQSPCPAPLPFRQYPGGVDSAPGSKTRRAPRVMSTAPGQTVAVDAAAAEGRPDHDGVRVELESTVPEVAEQRIVREENDAAAPDAAGGEPGALGEAFEVLLADDAADLSEPPGEIRDGLEVGRGLERAAPGVEHVQPLRIAIDAGAEGERVRGVEPNGEDGAGHALLPALELAGLAAAERTCNIVGVVVASADLDPGDG